MQSGTAPAGIVLKSKKESKPAVHVLIVGISQFKSNQLPALDGPEREAAAFADLFQRFSDRADVRSITTFINAEATRENVATAYKKMASSLSADETLILYWTGHAVYDSFSGKLKLPTFDTKITKTKSERGLTVGSLENFVDFRDDIFAHAHPEKRVVFIGDGCNIGDGAIGDLLHKNPNFAILTSAKSDELAIDSPSISPFSASLLETLLSAGKDLDGDGWLSVEELFVQMYPSMVRANVGRLSQHPGLFGQSTHRLLLATAEQPKVSPVVGDDGGGKDRFSVEISDVADIGTVELSLNGRPLKKEQFTTTKNKIVFLGDTAEQLPNGLSLLKIGAQRYHLWKAAWSLKAFREPYRRSAAIIVAIDDYVRGSDPRKRRATGFQQLTHMVARAEELKLTLMGLGFARDDIKTLYNEEATSEKIEEILRSYWVGGSNESVDRLVFYFGGHGSEFQGNSLLVTYDYEDSRRLLTSFQARDLVERHSRNIKANHVLFALDVCHSGLTVLGSSNDDFERTERDALGRLAVIERNVQSPARNILVAGTGEQKALWENGGIFTRALVDALNGQADTNHDNLIEFEEIGIYVRDRVTKHARLSGVRQDPVASTLEHLGHGRITFIRN